MGMFGIANMANAHVKWGKVVMICGEVVFVLFCRVWRDFGDDEQWWGLEFGGKQRYKRSVYNRGFFNRPYFVVEVRKNMVMYLKNQAGYKQSFFKGMKYEEIRPIFEKVWDQTHTFVPMDSEDKEKGTENKSGGTRKKTLTKKRAGEKQRDQSVKRQKTEYDTKKEELKDYLDIVPGEEFAMDFESLATKFPIVDWKTYVLAENFMYYQIFRADGSSDMMF
ncbi:hypothetical protein Tco_0471963 [Tanacetum coccineum]